MKKTFMFIVSLLFVLPSCFSESTKISEQSYDSFVNKLESTSYTLDLVTGYKISSDGVYTEDTWCTMQYQLDFADDSYFFCNPGINDSQCFAYIPYTGSAEKFKYYYCSTNWCQTEWAVLNRSASLGIGTKWFSDFSLLTFDESKKCYFQIITGISSTNTISYYIKNNEVKEIALESIDSATASETCYKYEINNIGSTKIRKPRFLNDPFIN